MQISEANVKIAYITDVEGDIAYFKQLVDSPVYKDAFTSC